MIFFTRIYFNPGANSWRAQCAHHQCADIPWAKAQSVSLLACQGLCAQQGAWWVAAYQQRIFVQSYYCTSFYYKPFQKVAKIQLKKSWDNSFRRSKTSTLVTCITPSGHWTWKPAWSCCASTLCTFLCQRNCPGRHISTDHLANFGVLRN